VVGALVVLAVGGILWLALGGVSSPARVSSRGTAALREGHRLAAVLAGSSNRTNTAVSSTTPQQAAGESRLLRACVAAGSARIRGRSRGLGPRRLLSVATARASCLAALQRVAARRLWLASPGSRQARVRSRTAYEGLSALSAKGLALRTFGGWLATARATPAADPTLAGHVLRYVSSREAVISSRTGRKIVVSTVPLVASHGGAAASPVDLRLRTSSGSFTPANPAAALSIGARLRKGVTIGSSGLRIAMDGADVAGGALPDRSAAMFADISPDTDALISATPLGAEFDAMLRSPRSPEELRYTLTLPAGAALHHGRGGVIDVLRAGRALAAIDPPIAADAQGSSVPVAMTYAGSTLILTIPHRRIDVAYPILVDPQVTVTTSSGSWSVNGPLIINPKTGSPYNGGLYGGSAQSLTASAGTYVGSPQDSVTASWSGPSYPTAGPATVAITFYDIRFADSDTTGVLGGQLLVGACNSGGDGRIVQMLSNTVITYPTYSTSGGCSGWPQPSIVNQVSNFGGTANGGELAQFGSATFSFDCASACPATGPSGPEAYGRSNPSEPEYPRTQCGHPVNCATGNQFEVQSDLSISGRGGGMSLVRTYNSQAAAQGATGPFGYGWSSSYSDHLAIDQAAGTAIVAQANGSTAPFTISGSSFVAQPWVRAQLVKNSDATYTYTLADQRSFHFDSTGKLLSEADRNGETTTTGYDSNGRLSTITDPAGRTITLNYNPNGTVSRAQDSSGRAVSYSYTSGNLTGVTDAVGGTWAFGYDSSNQLTSETDARGHTVTTAYTANRVTSQTDPATRQRAWSNSPGETVITNPDGTKTDEHFTGQLLTSITHAYQTSLAATTTYTYDENDNVAAITDPNGNVTSSTYDSAGNRLSQTDSLGRVSRWTYTSLNDVASATNPLGVTTAYGRDSHGNLVSVSTPLSGTSQTRTETFGRINSSHPGDITAVTDPNGHTTSLGYDAAGDLTAVTDALGNQTTYGYDSIGRRTSMVSARGNVSGGNPAAYTTTYGYDALSRLTSRTDPLGHTLSLGYDGNGNLTSSTDPNNHTTAYAFDADNELTTVTRPDTTTLQTGYDNAGNVISQTDGAGQVTAYGYNALEQLTSITDPLLRTTTRGYDLAGNLTSVKDPLARTTTYGYNADNEPISISYSDGSTPNLTYSYDGNGRRSSMTDGSGSSTYGYDSLDRLTTTTDGAGHTIGYGYDLASNQTSITYPGSSQTVTRGYDNANRLTSITDWLGNKTSFAYDPNSNLISTTFPSATSDSDTYGYDNADRLTAIAMSQGATALASLNYVRDAAGQLTNATEFGLPQPAHQPAKNFSYDNADNPTQLNGTTGYTYDTANQLTSFPSNTNTYDPLGERTKTTPSGTSATSYAYNQAGELSTYTPAGTSTTYGYDGNGLRTTKTTGSSTASFAWDHTAAVPLALSDSQNSYIYGPDGLPIEQINGTTPTYLHHDQLGSSRLLTNASGTVSGAASYSPYGMPAASSGTATTPLGYAGQYTDPETGLQYLRARYYDPTTGQFLTRDPLEQLTRQPYSYAQDNPINGTDPMGLCGTSSIGDLLDCVNPTSSGNLAYQGASAVGVAKQITAVVTSAPVVDAGAGAVCLFSEGSLCAPAVEGATAIQAADTLTQGAATNFCDPGSLVGQIAANALLLYGGAFVDAAAQLSRLGWAGRVALKAPWALLNTGYDAAQLRGR
jgi:RHS repeat-associated protein